MGKGTWYDLSALRGITPNVRIDLRRITVCLFSKAGIPVMLLQKSRFTNLEPVIQAEPVLVEA